MTRPWLKCDVPMWIDPSGVTARACITVRM
jgi:hypothetical protein